MQSEPDEEESRPIVTVDAALFTLNEDNKLSVAVIVRDHDPFAGELALPGVYIDPEIDQDAEAAARRALLQKAGSTFSFLEQLYSFSGRYRDPRGWSASTVYYAMSPRIRIGELAKIVPVDNLPILAFDHKAIIKYAVQRLRNKSTYSTLPTFLLPEQFTLPELHRVYEAIFGVKLDRANFRRKMLDQDVIEKLRGYTQTSGGRPAQLYRRSDRAIMLFQRAVV